MHLRNVHEQEARNKKERTCLASEKWRLNARARNDCQIIFRSGLVQIIHTAPVAVIATNFTLVLKIKTMQLVQPIWNWFAIPPTSQDRLDTYKKTAREWLNTNPKGTFLGL